MHKIENKYETLVIKGIDPIIKTSKEKQNELEKETKENEEKIGGYKITNNFDRHFKPGEKGFAIVLSEGIAGPDDLNVSIIVKYENGEITIRDTQQEPFGEQEYNEITLNTDEQFTGNNDVNKINKLISSRGFNTIKGDDLKKLAEKIESLKNN